MSTDPSASRVRSRKLWKSLLVFVTATCVIAALAMLVLPNLGAARRTSRQMQQATEERAALQRQVLEGQISANEYAYREARLLRSRVNGEAAVDDASAPPAQRPEDLSGRYNSNFNTEGYARLHDNPFYTVSERPLSTFSVDVDTASYANVRRFLLREQRMPPKDAVRIEELINYFDYGYSAPAGDPAEGEAPFAAHVAVAGCPWAPEHRLVRIGLKGWQPPIEQRQPANLVFLLDVSGSMRSPHKLPLLKQAMGKLVDQLRPEDRVAIVVYAGASGLVLDSTPATDRRTIRDALHRLRAGGSTNGGAGIELAYQLATEHFIDGGVNRVILATDGDFNVGTTNRGDLTRLIEEKAETGVYLSVLGFGTGNIKDDMMEQLSNKGDGNYAYIDSMREAEKVLVQQAAGTLVTIAKDVKLQVEFNPSQVQGYRLIGYANRLLDKEDFNDDTKDAGDIGAGHTVTALYQIVPAGVESSNTTGARPAVDPLKYQQPKGTTEAAASDELLTLKLRYKAPDAPKEQGTSKLLAFPVEDTGRAFADAPADFRFAAAVAGFGMLLRDSEHQGACSYDAVRDWAADALREDEQGYRAEFLTLVHAAAQLDREG
ncbi:MAG: vWA domain-containing protein [bacterium]